MFSEEGKGQVKTDELEWLVSLLGINSTKSELASTAKDVDRVSEADRDSRGRQGSPVHDKGCATLTGHLLPTEKGFFNCSNLLALMGLYWEKAQNQEGELRAALCIFDKEARGYIDWDTLK